MMYHESQNDTSWHKNGSAGFSLALPGDQGKYNMTYGRHAKYFIQQSKSEVGE